ncbi:MAG: hypothetical protein RL684_648 [Pseudomonadota bacterium]
MRSVILIPLLATALAACGGGGSAKQAAAFNLQAGFTNLVRSGEMTSVSLSGNVIVGGVTTPFTGTGMLTLSPSVAATFNGTAGISQVTGITGTVTSAGQTVNYTSSATEYYSSGTLTLVGESTASEYDVAQAPFSFPTVIVGGESGTLGTLDRYTDSTLSLSLGTIQVTYAVPIGIDSPLVTAAIGITAKIYDTQNTLVETDVTHYSLTTSNSLTFSSASTQNASGSLLVSIP